MSVKESDPGMVDYFLLDLAFDSQALRDLYEAQPRPDYELIYRGTPFQNVMLEGPVLVRPVDHEDRELLERKVAGEKAIAIRAPGVAMADLSEHLRRWLQVKTPEGGIAVFRFADPRLFPAIRNVLEPHERNLLLGPARAFSGVHEGEQWQLTPDDQCPVEPLTDPFPLRDEHLAAIQQWREQALLAGWSEALGRSVGLLENWYRQLMSGGVKSEYDIGLACEALAKRGVQRELEAADTEPLRATSMNATDFEAWAEELSQIEGRGVPA